jgi:Tol biopolymer transport system component
LELARTPSRWRSVALLLLSVLLAGAVFAWRELRPPTAAQPVRLVPLTTLPGAETFPTLAPDGNHVAFTWSGPKQDNDDIYVQRLDSGGALQLTKNSANDFSPAWSPDGRWIAFLRGQLPGKAELRLIAPLGGPERLLTEIRIEQGNPSPPYMAWFPDSRSLIAVDSPGEGKPDQLVVVSRETGEKRPMGLQASDIPITMPAVSPDGRSVVFERAGELHVVDLKDDLTADKRTRRLTNVSLGALQPTWAPDGKEVLFCAQRSLWRMDVSGAQPPERVPFVGEGAFMPVLSRLASGQSIRLVYVRASSDLNIWRLDVAAPGTPASSSAVMSISSTMLDQNPQFSPDGGRVAFQSNRSGSQEIWLADPDGANAVQLTTMTAPITGTPRWSPNGQTIAFDSNREGQFEIYVVAASGGPTRRVTSHAGDEVMPSFSRDGNWIYFGSNRTGSYQIWKVPSSGGQPVQVTSNGGAAAFESPNGEYIYYTQTPMWSSSLWRSGATGGEPVKILDEVSRSFTVVDKGIYYIDLLEHQSGPMVLAPTGRPTLQVSGRLRFRDFVTTNTTTVADLGTGIGLGLTVSPDGRTVLFSKFDAPKNDLEMVENFR